ncbi:MAG: RagB/SusD family nutrient uptake outer membrane protein [Draconibacterium sp.]
MKNIIKILTVCIFAVLGTVSCDLDKYPSDKIEQSQAFKTIEDATAFRNGIYANLRGRLYGTYTFTTDIQADLLNATLDYGNRNGMAHKWTPFLADDYTIRDIWRDTYAVLVNVNNIIENIESIPTENDEDAAKIQKYLGEAYFLRAYYYHELVQRFAKDYDPATASSDLGVPLVLVFDVTLLPERASVEQVYQQINSDLAAAKTRLAGVAGESDASRFTIDCVAALEARVKLCMHDYTGAASTAKSLTTSSAYSLIENEVEFKDMWVNDISTEVIFQYPLSAPNELGNTNNVYLGYKPDIDKYTPDFVPQQWVIDLYEENDIRKSVYFEKKLVHIQGFDYPDIYCVNKYPGNPALWTEANTNYQQKPKVFRLAEMYLIQTEALAMAGGKDGEAVAVLNELREARGASSLGNLTGDALLQAVKDERTRELMFEGNRLYDLKRWNMGFERKAPQNMDLIITGADFNEKRVTAGDNKFV